MRTIIAVLLLVGSVALADVELGPKTRTANKSAIRELRKSAAWIGMTNQLAQYDAHYTAATNNAAQIADSKTKAAVLNTIRATDDCHDALVKLMKCFADYVKANDK